MQTVNLYSVKDTKAQAFREPFPARHTSEAVRGFTSAVQNQDTEFGRFPEDFELYQIAEVNLDNGLINQIGPEFIVGGKSLQKWVERIMDKEKKEVKS